MDPQKAPIPPLSEQAPNGPVPPIIHTKTSLEEIAYGPPTTFRRNSDGCKEVRRNSVGIVQS
ncbi:hypothetical protein DY000_02059041 [Brassica cretica]|uniref:Uncharacterized protein n=1 Tax=Brassica cretica TaxID=69181 RepID=A0ABQ7AQK4_BRACR|nr:hypothetical protein DY000_02059041 [Brassica cretica]